MKILYIFIIVLLYSGSAYISAQCTASFSGATTTCCPNDWLFTDSSQVRAGDSIISWHWNMPGGIPSSDTIQNTYTTYPALGLYTTCLTIVTMNGCTDSSCQTINVTSLSVDEKDPRPVISISPNPFSTLTLIEVSKSLLNATLSIYNSYGQCVEVIENLTEQNIILDREHFSSGIYFVRLADGHEIMIEKLIIE